MKISPIIGLEVHVELKTKSKMFCGCDANHFHVEPNTHTCPVCLGLPGALPVPNKTACDWCIKIGLALGCEVNKLTFFERKNYFYPDLAKGFQITQLQKPFSINGKLIIDDQEITINRVHMEEDTGKSVHIDDSTLIDFNRSGVPLVEIVSEPDIHSSAIAKKYLQKLQQIIRYIGVSDADIEKGSLRCEPTINLMIEDNGKTYYTPLAEIKNVASLTGVENAIDFEVNRQTEQFKIDHQQKNSSNKTTRGWDADKNQTFLQREKEENADYRYFPEPDLPPIEYSETEIEAISKSLPELPNRKIVKYKSYGLSDYDSQIIADNSLFATAFERAIGEKNDKEFCKFVANIFIGPILTLLNKSQSEIDLDKIKHEYFYSLFKSVSSSEISNTMAKQVIIESYQIDEDPVYIAAKKGLIQVSDPGKIEMMARQVILDNPKAVNDYKKNPLTLSFLIGQLMKVSLGSANPSLAKETLEKLLGK